MTRRVVRLPVLLLLLGCAGLPLADSPFQRITRARPGESARIYLAAVRPERVPSRDGAVASMAVADADVRAAVCAGLRLTRFRCVRVNGKGPPAGKPDYVIRVEYDVVDGSRFFGGASVGGVIFRGAALGGNDPPGDAAHSVRWGFRVTRAGETAPLFESGFREESLQFWRFEVEAWTARYFSE